MMRPEIEIEKRQLSLREQAYKVRFDPAKPEPPDEVCLHIGDIPIAARGNLSGLQGKSKVGKSSVVSAVLAAAYRGNATETEDTFQIGWAGEANGAILHLDTEQSRGDWHRLVELSMERAGVSVGDRLVSLPLVMFARSERLEILREALEYERGRLGSVDLVAIDGVADLCRSPNDEAEALELVSELHALAQEFDCAIICVIHENPGTADAKTRGHLGSELNRKAFANLRVDKDAKTLVSTIYGTDMRKRDLPKDQGFCFAWSDEAGMHIFKGRAAGVKAAQTEEEKVAKEREYFMRIFASSGTHAECPALTLDEAFQACRNKIGTTGCPSRDAMKKRMQRAEGIGVLTKSTRGQWSMNGRGQSGQQRDKE